MREMRRRIATSERYAPFDVVVLPFPYADRLAEKRRPALIVSGAALRPREILWVVMITSAENAPWPDDIPIVDLGRAGLPAASVVRPAKIAAVEPGRIMRRAGSLEPSVRRAVAATLRGLPAAR